MGELVRCKVRDIKDSAGRWEIRLERQILPPVVERLAREAIRIKFPTGEYAVSTGIASKGKPNQYFWINTRKGEAGPIKSILKTHGYEPNNEIVLSVDEANRFLYVMPNYALSKKGHRYEERGAKNQLKLNDPNEARIHNIIDMALHFSAMIRLFDKGSKRKLRDRILADLGKIFDAKSEEHFKDIHSDFCNWGIQHIVLAERRKNGQITKKASPATYGQIAKTFDVVLKVAVYYSHLPNCEKSQQILPWLHAAVDTKMMAYLKKCYAEDIASWPATIEQVDSSAYMSIQEIVRKFIGERHNGSISPVQFDDIYWEALNRQQA